MIIVGGTAVCGQNGSWRRERGGRESGACVSRASSVGTGRCHKLALCLPGMFLTTKTIEEVPPPGEPTHKSFFFSPPAGGTTDASVADASASSSSSSSV